MINLPSKFCKDFPPIAQFPGNAITKCHGVFLPCMGAHGFTAMAIDGRVHSVVDFVSSIKVSTICDPIQQKVILSTFEKIEIFALYNRRFNKLSNDTIHNN